MLRLLVPMLALAVLGQKTPISPCPGVFSYEPPTPGMEPGRWYGVLNMKPDENLIWLNIVLDSKAELLGNEVGEISTNDNIEYKIENPDLSKLNGGIIRFFVSYNQLRKAPKVQTIKLNGDEICNAGPRQPSASTGASSSTPRPEAPLVTSRPQTTQQGFPPGNQPQFRLVPGRPIEAPVYVRPVKKTTKPPSNNGGVRPPLNIDLSLFNNPSQNNNIFNTNSVFNNNFGLTTAPPPFTTTTGRTEILDYDDSANKEPRPEDYFSGGGIEIKVSADSARVIDNNAQTQVQCGSVVLNNANPLATGGIPTLEGQWPWHVAIYRAQKVDSKYTCGGSLVSHRHVVTAAHCVTLKDSRRLVNVDTLSVYLGKCNLRTSVKGVQFRFVESITLHPDYNPSTYSRDLAILTLLEPVTYTSWVRPVCLWPDQYVDLGYVVMQTGSVVGWGYDDNNTPTEELNLVMMPVVDQDTCIRSNSVFFGSRTSDFTLCAGFRNGTSVCNGDSGGGMFFQLGSEWYLRGLVSVSVVKNARCDTSHFIIFTDLAKLLPWLRQNIYD